MDSLDDKTLFKRTLLTVAAMVGACVVVVGTFSLIALVIVGRATRSPSADETTPVLAPAANGDAPKLPAAPLKAPAKPSQI